MKSGVKALAIGLATIIVILLIFIAWGFGTRNHLMSLKEDVDMQESQVETALQRRSDLIPNLVSTVKGYASHEEKVYKEIADARTKLAESLDGKNIDDISKANSELDTAVNKLLAISEDYPDLKASEQFTGLQDELAGSENRISVARQHYNEKVKDYNKAVQYFPSSIIASMNGYEKMSYFKADESAKEVPKVSFD